MYISISFDMFYLGKLYSFNLIASLIKEECHWVNTWHVFYFHVFAILLVGSNINKDREIGWDDNDKDKDKDDDDEDEDGDR